MIKKYSLILVALLCSFFYGNSQIITFDFNGLVGNEATASSNYNDANLSNSVISRGGGLTASNNANRFNATSWALTDISIAVSGNDYMEFTIVPNSGYQFDVTTININFERSGTGTSGIALRSSIDGYTTNIDGEKSIVDNTNIQTFTFNVNQLNNTTNVIYRFYGYAEATGGSGGFEGTGNDIVVNGTVTATDDIDWCNLQWPASGNINVGGSHDVYARVYEDGTTNGAGQGLPMNVWVGYSTSDTDPSTWTNWVSASYIGDVDSNANDEYMATLSGLSSGTYYYASRFEYNNSGIFHYGGYNSGGGGFWDGTTNVSGILSVDTVDWCNLQTPQSGTINLGDNFDVYGQVYEVGVTPGGGQGPGITAEIIYSTSNTNPNTWTDTVSTIYNTTCTGGNFCNSGENDEYYGNLGAAILAPGTYYYALRYTLNSGAYIYGGILADGSAGDIWDGITYISGVLTINSNCTNIFSDDFSSGLGSWSNTSDWTIDIGELNHSLTTGVAGTSYFNHNMTTQNLNSGNYEWEVCMRYESYDPSGNNNFSFFLLSDDADLGTSPTGYAVGVNQVGSSDLLSLYSVNNGTYSAIITSAFDWNANDDVCIRVTRSITGDWELLYNENGNGEVSGGTITNTDHTTGSNIGGLFNFTSTRQGLLWIDDVSVCSDVVITGPEIQLNDGMSNVDCGSFDIDFGNVESNNSFSEISFDINNIGSSDLNLSSLTILGDPSFTIVNPATLPPPDIVVSAGGTQSITIRFEPTTIGPDTSTLTIGNTDTNEGACVVTLQGIGVVNPGNGSLLITQYYEGLSFNKWIEIANVSGGVIPDVSIYYLASYNQSFSGTCSQRPLGGLPTNSIALPAISMQPGDVIRLCEPTPNGTTSPNYAAPSVPNGPTGNDGNPTYYMFNQSFSGDDIIVISTTDDADCYNNRIDVIGEYSSPCGTANWGQQKSLVRKEECSTSATTSITFDINDWIEYAYNDPLITSATSGTNEYIGQHFQGITTFTSGSWDNGLPNNTRTVVISENYDTSTYGSFESCSLTINNNSTLDIKDGDYVSIETDLSVDVSSTLEIQNEGQLIMVEDTGVVTNSGTTNINKTTAIMQPYDYVYWSSPIDYGPPLPPQGIAFVLTEFLPNRMYSFNTSAYQDDLPVINGDGFDDDQNDWVLHSSFMDKGIGYATMTANVSAQVNNAIFSGKVNNGIINVTLSLSSDVNTDADGDEDDWNLIGNPYPSAISADSLVNQNIDINGTIYFWTHNTDISISNPGPDAFNFSTDDYAMYNFSGGVGTGTPADTGGGVPTGNIASGQGFFVDAINTGTVTFNNSMRSKSLSNDDFFRNSENVQPDDIQEKDRFWVNLTNPDGAFSQVLVGFFEDATFEKDRLYDGVRLKGTNYVNLYTTDDTELEYGIQGRPTFDSSDIIPLGYSSNLVGNMQIELSERNGILLDETIYLVDKYLYVTHDLTISPYVYSTEIGAYNDRFEIVFEEDALGLGENELNGSDLMIIELPNGNVMFKLNGNLQMESVQIIDLLGRTLYVLDGEGKAQRTFDLSNLSLATYLATVTLTDGRFITKKAINSN